MKSMLMQLKREFWELKDISFRVPTIFVSVLTALVCLLLLLAALFGKIQFSMTDEVVFWAEQANQINILFDSEQDNLQLKPAQHNFVWLENPVAQSNPELIRNESEIGNKTNKYRKFSHTIKDDIENRITQITDSFEFMFLALLLMPLVTGLIANKKDQSLLFWRSMPVSDVQVVFSKFLFVFVVIPCIYLLTIWLGLTAVITSWTIIELVSSNSNVMPIYPELWQALSQLMLLSPALFFKLLWFMPVYAFLLIMFMLAGHSKTLPPIIFFSSIIALAIERQIFTSPWVNNLLRDYFSNGITYSQHIKWTVLWGDQFPPVNYLALAACLLASLVLITLVILLRQKQQA